MAPLVDFKITAGIAAVTINRPSVRNCINDATATAVVAAVDEIESRDDVVVAILTGAGDCFCSGMDLKAYLDGETGAVEGRGFGGFVKATRTKPFIAAVEGYAIAGGFELALACDLIVASETAKFGLPEVKRGLVATGGGVLRLPRLIPPRIATELVLTGELIGAVRLHEVGLINRLAQEGSAQKVARELAAQIAANGPLAVAAARRVLEDSQDWSTKEMFDRQRALTDHVFTSEDAKEGARAFKERRSPVWRGR